MTGDTQALAPATEEQAAEAAAPETGAEGAAEDDVMAEDAYEEPLPGEQSTPTEEQVNSTGFNPCFAYEGPHEAGLIIKSLQRIFLVCKTVLGKLHTCISWQNDMLAPVCTRCGVLLYIVWCRC